MDRSSAHSKANNHPRSHSHKWLIQSLQLTQPLICMSLDCTGENPRRHEENMIHGKTMHPHTEIIFLLLGNSANHCTTVAPSNRNKKHVSISARQNLCAFFVCDYKTNVNVGQGCSELLLLLCLMVSSQFCLCTCFFPALSFSVYSGFFVCLMCVGVGLCNFQLCVVPFHCASFFFSSSLPHQASARSFSPEGQWTRSVPTAAIPAANESV